MKIVELEVTLNCAVPVDRLTPFAISPMLILALIGKLLSPGARTTFFMDAVPTELPFTERKNVMLP